MHEDHDDAPSSSPLRRAISLAYGAATRSLVIVLMLSLAWVAGYLSWACADVMIGHRRETMHGVGVTTYAALTVGAAGLALFALACLKRAWEHATGTRNDLP